MGKKRDSLTKGGSESRPRIAITETMVILSPSSTRPNKEKREKSLGRKGKERKGREKQRVSDRGRVEGVKGRGGK